MAAGSSLALLERTERVSPELVLIDPALAERARFELAEPDDTVARLEALARESAIAAATRRLADLDLAAAPEPRGFQLRRRERSRSHGRRRHPVLAVGFATATLTTALALGMSTDPGGAPTAVESAAMLQAPAQPPPQTAPPAAAPPAAAPARSAPATTQRRPRNRTPAVSRPTARPFAWAPSAGASAYQVELYRGDQRVFAARTTKPAIEVPPTWRFAGRKQSLSPGSYRWYVWPVVSGERALEATVQAKLVIPAA